MNTRDAGRPLLAALFAVSLTAPFLTKSAAMQSARNQPTVNVEVANGLRVVTFASARGNIRVNLPDDIRAGDTISGTVVAEPKGSPIKEFVKQTDTLEGQVVVVGNQRVSVSSNRSFVVTFPGLMPSGAVITPYPKITQPTHPSGAIITPDPKITTPQNTTPPGGRVVPGMSTPALPMSFFDVFIEPGGTSGTDSTARARIPLGPPATHPSGAIVTPDPKTTPPMTSSGAIITPDPNMTPPITIPGTSFGSKPQDLDNVPYSIPPLGQTGKPIVITGPFDGNSSNTTGGFGTGGALELLAESPRKAVFQNPSNVVGPTQITVKEGTTQATENFRNLGIDLTAPKTSLLREETTELKIEVHGLEGIKQSVPLTIESSGVITMAGGTYQPLMIQPSQVGADGRYSTTRTVTGVKAGGWSATATVVTYSMDVKLEGENCDRHLSFNSFTGDYTFNCPGCSETVDTGPATGGSVVSSLAPVGKGTLTQNGCTLTLKHSAPDCRVMATVDQCANTGTATIEVPAKKVKFTITDRNIGDNTCAVH
jgi:hypothetical protein